MMEWRYGIVNHTESGTRYSSLAEVYFSDNDIPIAWSETPQSYLESPKEIRDNLRMIVDDLNKHEPYDYPDDFNLSEYKMFIEESEE